MRQVIEKAPSEKRLRRQQRGRGKKFLRGGIRVFPGAGELEKGSEKKEKCTTCTVMENKMAGFFFSPVTYFEHWAAWLVVKRHRHTKQLSPRIKHETSCYQSDDIIVIFLLLDNMGIQLRLSPPRHISVGWPAKRPLCDDELYYLGKIFLARKYY